MNGSMHYAFAKGKTADKQREAEHARMIREAAEAVRASARNSRGDAGTARDTGRIASGVRSILRPKTA